jgi:large subunit ribosomal protein L30
MSSLSVTYRKSAIGYASDQKRTVAALGLRRLQQTVVHPDTPAIRGMVRKVCHLVSVDGHPADSPAGRLRLAAPVSADLEASPPEPAARAAGGRRVAAARAGAEGP